jgi:hypothetical protein
METNTVQDMLLADEARKLLSAMDGLTDQISNWQSSQEKKHLETIEALNERIDSLQRELDGISSRVKINSEKMESLSELSPRDLGSAALQRMPSRINHLENSLSELIEKVRSESSRARKQLFISVGALGIAVILWAVWMGLVGIK